MITERSSPNQVVKISRFRKAVIGGFVAVDLLATVHSGWQAFAVRNQKKDAIHEASNKFHAEFADADISSSVAKYIRHKYGDANAFLATELGSYTLPSEESGAELAAGCRTELPATASVEAAEKCDQLGATVDELATANAEFTRYASDLNVAPDMLVFLGAAISALAVGYISRETVDSASESSNMMVNHT